MFCVSETASALLLLMLLAACAAVTSAAAAQAGPQEPGRGKPPAPRGIAHGDSLPADSAAVGKAIPRAKARPAPGPAFPAGAAGTIDSLDAVALVRASRQDPRDAIREGLGIDFLDAGSPHTIEPLFFGVPGLIVPEIRRDGLPEGPVGWPEPPFLSLPLLEVRSAVVRRYSPVLSPLSATGGPTVVVHSVDLPHDEAASAVRLTRGNYETFTNELSFRRPLGRVLFGAWFGDTKTGGRYPWRRQTGEMKGVRFGIPAGRGWVDASLDGGKRRLELLSTKKANWNRTSLTLRYARGDSAAIRTRVNAQVLSSRGRWETLEGVTSRASREIFVRAEHDRPRVWGGRATFVVEGDYTDLDVRVPGAVPRLLRDLSMGVAAGLARPFGGGRLETSGGLTRLAPLDLAPVGSIEWARALAPGVALELHASRAVMHRTFPRLPADGEAWVLQGTGLVEEEGGAPQSLWIGGLGWKATGVEESAWLEILVDGAWSRGGLDLTEAQVPLLAGGLPDVLPESALRGARPHFLPQVRGALALPLTIRIDAALQGTISEGGWRANPGTALARGTGRIGWSRHFLENDVLLGADLLARGRSETITPYGALPSEVRLDGTAWGRIGRAQAYFTLANLSDTRSPSASYDGGFGQLPGRSYRAGLRWDFAN